MKCQLYAYAFLFLLIQSSALQAVASSWTNACGGNWNSGNWTCGQPNGVGDSATLSNQGCPYTVTLNCTRTVGSLTMSGNQLKALAGSGTLVFDACGAGPASLTFSNGGHDITVATIQLNDDLTITRNSGTSCIDSVITGTGGITKAGVGWFRLNGNNTFSGDRSIAYDSIFGYGYFKKFSTTNNTNLHE